MLTEYVIQQLRWLKGLFGATNTVTYKTLEGVYTWYRDSKAVYFKKPNTKYFSDKGKFLGNVAL